jgi:two-component system sensor kinase FixL
MARHNATGETRVVGKTIELSGLRKDDSEFPLELSLSSWTTKEGNFYSGIIRDITERKHAEIALEAAAQRESALIENALDVICSIDAEGRFASVSHASTKVFGYTPEELIGRKYIELVAADDAEKTNEIAAKIVSGERTADFENRYLHKNGTHVHILWSASWSEEEQLMFCVAHDNTERKLNEEKMRKFAAELQRSNSELQDFASVASHDLQEPLRKIQAFADELKTNLSGSIGEEDSDTMERMIAAAGRMRNLINDLLAFSRITTLAKPFVPVDLNALLKEVLSDLEVRTRDTGGRIEAGHLPTIDADPMQMRQLFQNLIGNGLKFSRPGESPVIKISGENGGANCRLTIADNGIGFDEKYLDRIFTIFQRLHGRNEYEGTGIGLAVCRKIVERHGGQLTARSAVGEGATFIITLPVKQSKQEK